MQNRRRRKAKARRAAEKRYRRMRDIYMEATKGIPPPRGTVFYPGTPEGLADALASGRTIHCTDPAVEAQLHPQG